MSPKLVNDPLLLISYLFATWALLDCYFDFGLPRRSLKGGTWSGCKPLVRCRMRFAPDHQHQTERRYIIHSLLPGPQRGQHCAHVSRPNGKFPDCAVMSVAPVTFVMPNFPCEPHFGSEKATQYKSRDRPVAPGTSLIGADTGRGGRSIDDPCIPNCRQGMGP
jgi:hypothetical protein